MKWYHHLIVFFVILACMAYTDKRAYKRGVVETTAALEQFLCPKAKGAE